MLEKNKDQTSKPKNEPPEDNSGSVERSKDNVWNEKAEEENEGSHNPLEDADKEKNNFSEDLL